jgi:hypothetical protein
MRDGTIIQKNLSPYEVRLELLKMAQTMLEADYYARREIISNEYASKCQYANIHGGELPTHPGYPSYPTETDIIAKAQTLNGFVSNIPPIQEKTSKKST